MYRGKDGTFVAATFDEMGIQIPYGKTGQFKTFCPECKNSRTKQKNQRDTPLSVDLNEQIANCHNCGAKFVVDKGGYLENSHQKKYDRPKPQETYDKIDSATADWFETRRISIDTLKKLKVTSGTQFMP